MEALGRGEAPSPRGFTVVTGDASSRESIAGESRARTLTWAYAFVSLECSGRIVV